MAQKYYTSYKLGNPNKAGLRTVYIRVTGAGNDIKIPTSVKITEDQFAGDSIKRHTNKVKLNAVIEKEKRRVDDLLLDANLKDIEVTPAYLNEIFSSKDSLWSFRDKFVDAIKNSETKKSRKSIFKKLPDVKISEIGLDFMKSFEKRLWDDELDQNTIHTQMVRVKTLMFAIIKKELITNQKIIKAITEYSPPAYLDKVPEYLTVEEIKSFFTLCRTIGHVQKKKSGYYFLLSCFTGWRLKDLVTFNYEDRVKDGSVLLRASKNSKIVSIPIYPDLEEVLIFCRDNPLTITEQHFRLYVKQLAADIGIPPTRNIKIHTGRHSFAMMLLTLGFSIDEVGELLGDTPEVTRIYARINNRHLANKVKEKLFKLNAHNSSWDVVCPNGISEKGIGIE